MLGSHIHLKSKYGTRVHARPIHNCVATDCRHGDIRLAGSISNPLQGRVEVCYEGVWSTICALNGLSAEVVCRQLGYVSLGISKCLKSDSCICMHVHIIERQTPTPLLLV